MRERIRAIHAYICGWIPDPTWRALVFQIIGLFSIALVLGVYLHRRIPVTPAWARANALAQQGELAGAEGSYWEYIQAGPVTVPLLVDFLENHKTLKMVEELPKDDSRGRLNVTQKPTVTDQQIEQLLMGDALPAPVAIPARFWWHVLDNDVGPALRKEILEGANQSPPMPWANHVLGMEALHAARLSEAADRFEHEGLTFADRREDAKQALHLWIVLKDWGKVGERMSDPRYHDLIDPIVRHEYALHVRDWTGAAKWLLIANTAPKMGPLLLAAVSALMWFSFCARLGKAKERPLFRGTLYTVAFALGVVSVVPTLGILVVEETFFKLVETGDPVRDALYFVCGVGFREELSKLLLFLPLLPILRRFGTRLDVLACGAMVGLGFAAEENLSYFQSGDPTTAIGRFLTANFMHISMTSILAGALDDFSRDPEKQSMQMTKSFLTVVALHGAYDFFAGSTSGLSFLSMTIFVILTRQFLRSVTEVRGRPEPEDKFLRRFVQAVAVVVGASFVYACAIAGPSAAAAILALGLLGDAIIIYMFVQETRAA